MSGTPATALTRLRKLCMALPDVTERLSHGAPAWFVGRKQFCAFANNHHGDGRLAIWCAGTRELQAMLVDSDPEGYFVPAYVGARGWLGVRLDRDLAWSQVGSLLEAAHQLCAAPPKRPRAKAS